MVIFFFLRINIEKLSSNYTYEAALLKLDYYTADFAFFFYLLEMLLRDLELH